MEVAVFGGGCFWCTEAIFKMLKGIELVEPGYAGGTSPDPNYQNIGDHAEAVKIKFDPALVSYANLLTVFFATHDPTTPNTSLRFGITQQNVRYQQGADIGTQYRSIILYTTPAQKEAAETFIRGLNDSSEIGEPVLTEVRPLEHFYAAEDYHRNFYARNSSSGYCQVVINPKLAKVKHEFSELIGS